MSGWELTEWMVASAAAVTAAGVIWKKVVKGMFWNRMVIPIRQFVRRFKEWMAEVESSVQAVKEQLEPNGGSTLLDKVNANSERIARIDDRMTRMDRNVQMLLTHDAERDRHGMRYGEHPDRGETSP